MTTTTLTPEQIDALDLDALRIECAKALGKTPAMRWCEHDPDHGWIEERQHWYEVRGLQKELQAIIDDGDFRQCLCDAYHVGEQTLYQVLPDYPRDIAAAWGLMEAIRQLDGLVVFSILGDKPGYAIGVQTRHGSADAEADTAPEAICRAFLKVITAR